MQIGNFELGKNSPYVIAEIGANHNGSRELGQQMIEAAKRCKANAVKFQSWNLDSLWSSKQLTSNPQLSQEVEQYALTKEDHIFYKNICEKLEIDFLSTPFSKEEVDLLVQLEVPALKIASMDLNYFPLIKYIGTKALPVLLSTGMGEFEEIESAVSLLDKTNLVLLHCVSLYPPKEEQVNLRNIPMLQEMFGTLVGFSDHSLGSSLPIAAVALGAAVIEKHFTLDKSLPGWDHAISADPKELASLVSESHRVFKSLGRFERQLSCEELEKRKAFRRQAVAGTDLPAGKVLNEDDLHFRRPGTGIPPTESSKLVGKSLKRNLLAGHEISWQDLASE